MKSPNRDPLLMACKALILCIQGMMAIAVILMALFAVAAIFFENYFNAELQAATGPDFVAMPLGAVLGLLLIVIVACALLFLFFGKLRELIDTVAAGDPFVPQNADRLWTMAWLQTGIYSIRFIVLPLDPVITQWRQQFSEVTARDGFDLNLPQIGLILILFILARVFKHGAAMREDLEGTV